MSIRNQNMKNTNRTRRPTRGHTFWRQRPDRRGVLLMVVLSMLALFLLLGTAFLVTSNFYQKSSRDAAKLNRTGNSPSDLLERAMLQLLRDTNNPSSVLKGHSLLRDVYGTDGFIGRVLVPNGQVQLMAQYAGASLGSSPGALGSTQGQLIDLFMMDDGAGSPPLPEAAHVIKLERAPDGMPVDYDPSRADGYYNGCLLTMLDGPAAGQTTRILDYRFVGMFPEPLTGSGNFPVWRLRVMVFPRADGEALNVGTAGIELQELVQDRSTFTGHAFMVNGRPFNGTGVGYNRLAAAGTPRLNAVEREVGPGGFFGTEIALTPNARYVDTTQAASPLNGDPFETFPLPPIAAFPLLNPTADAVLYPTAEGPGGADESYDIADYQNMFLARMPLTPRAMAGLVDGTGVAYELGSQEAHNLINSSDPMRVDSENSVLPSFHRPALVNFWYHRFMNVQWLPGTPNENELAQTIVAPYGPDAIRGNTDDPTGVDLALRDQIVAIKRKIMMRPIPEDHPNFDGSNLASRTLDPEITNYGENDQIRYPFWEVIGPWDVDNDNDGIPDSVWIDLGDPVQKTEEGRLYKAMYAFLVVDLDSRLNLNAHGSVDHFANTDFDPIERVVGNVGNLSGGDLQAQGSDPTRWSSNRMPVGMGWGPGDISLRSILSPVTFPYSGSFTRVFGDPTSDDYARLFMGRVPGDLLSDAIYGRSGTSANTQPGRSLSWDNTTGAIDPASRDSHTPFDFVGYPVADQLRSIRRGGVPQYTFPSSFGTSPDLRCRQAIGIDYSGQPAYEAVWENLNPVTMAGDALVPLVDDSPYEMNLSSSARRGLPSTISQDDDAPFAVAELERLLRSYDPEAGTAPSRLWDLVDTFDPNKSVLTLASNPSSPSPEELALAQTLTQVARRQVTTDSYEIPTPADVVPSYITELGPDGLPGNVGDDDGQDSDGDGTDAEDVVPFNVATGVGEIGWYEIDSSDNRFLSGWSDDFASLTGKSVAEARLVDVLWYRIQKSRIERGINPYNFNHVESVAQLNAISEQLLPPEVLAGYKMDLNRPFGDGRDNNGNGIVDEPIEAGEPYLDENNNGRWDVGEKFVDLDGDGQYYADKDEDGNIDVLDIDGDGNFEPVVDNLWAAQLGTPALVDNAMGKDVSGRLFVDLDSNGVFDPNETLRDDKHLARQLYARHLYVLMLLLTDEEYVAPYNMANPQVRRYLRLKGEELRNATGSIYATQGEAELAAQRKYTCRQMAQWAVNCVDFRDSDACMTPFEYDENPWDGWNCVDTNGTPNDPTDDTFFPLDGDPGTDENHGQRVDWEEMVAQNITNGEKLFTIGATGNPDFTNRSNELNALDSTRNCVWGAERPELLITETLAFHDRRQEDLAGNNSSDHQETAQINGGGNNPDADLDQRLRPRGSAFFELYNPWSGDGQRPAELYSKHTRNPATGDLVDVNGDGQLDGRDMQASPGVELGRLSNHADSRGRRSPVWRMIVVEELPSYRNHRGVDDLPNTSPQENTYVNLAESHSAIEQSVFREHYEAGLQASNPAPDAPVFIPTDPDWDEMFSFRQGGRRVTMKEWIPRLSGTVTTQNPDPTNANDPNEPVDYQRKLIVKPYPYIEREIYFISNNSPSLGGSSPRRLYTNVNVGAMVNEFVTDFSSNVTGSPHVRIPYRYMHLEGGNGRTLLFRFVSKTNPTSQQEVQLAPLMPGRYCVVGSGGTQYPSFLTALDEDGNVRQDAVFSYDSPRFISTVGRLENTTPGRPWGATTYGNKNNLQQTRRFEMIPSTDPNVQQFMVAMNGGNPGLAEGSRQNELFRVNNSYRTAFDFHTTPGDSDENGEPDANIVHPTIAVPIDALSLSEPICGYEVREREISEAEGLRSAALVWDPQLANGEGMYRIAAGPESYDMPFDDEAVLAQTGTTPNFRCVHLQRLADPTLPWNPAPGYASHDSERFAVVTHDPSLPMNPYLTVDSASVDLTTFNGTNDELPNPPTTRIAFRSLERGAKATAIANGATIGNAEPLRQLYAQEPARKLLQLQQSLPTDRRAISIPPQYFDFTVGHSLGFANEAYGDIYLKPESRAADPNVIDPTDANGNDNDPITFGVAAGAPRFDTAANLASTFPWFTWNNRPFVSGNELLQVPAASSSTMLRQYSTMNTVAAINNQIDGYFGDEKRNGTDNLLPINNPAPPDADNTNARRFNTLAGQFGHLLNAFQSSRTPAVIDEDMMGNPVPVGAPNFHRILDYVHTPSRFVGTDALLNPTIFTANSTVDPVDPRQELLAPFNRVPEYREPGKINLNTMIGQRLPTGGNPQLWSDVYDGLMHRVRDGNVMNGTQLVTSGHFGPAWRDVVLSRRGYPDPVSAGANNGIDRTEMVLHSGVPTFFGNPFRSSGAGDLVPLSGMVQSGVDASMLRSHPFRPGERFAWGTPESDNDGNGLFDDCREAGITGDGTPFGLTGAAVPLFSELSSTAAIGGTRNPGMSYMPLTRLDNLTTPRSGVFAAWVTVGYFEVTPAPRFTNVEQKFLNQTGGDPIRARALYNRVYPQGYQLGKELGSETGDIDRQRGFYIIDRTHPVAFKPGEDVNVEETILLRRRIE